jgi:Protein of unknown function (DUF3987)
MSAPVTLIDATAPRRELERAPATRAQAPAGEPLPLIPPAATPAPFPVAALGGVLADATQAIVALVQCPPALAAQSVLAAAALATQGHDDVMHPMGKAVPLSLAFVTVAESGERKSTADALALHAFEQIAAEQEPMYRLAFARWRNACEANEAARAKAKKQGDRDRVRHVLDDIGPDPDAPLQPRRIAADPNYEGLVVKFMPSAHGSLGWFNNEAGQSVGGTALHDDNKLKFGAGLSKLWDGQAIDRIRAGDGVHVLRGRRLTTHLMLQPEIAHGLLSDPVLRSQGWLSRVLVCEPESRIGHRPFRAPLDADKAKLLPFYRRIRELIETPCPCGDKANELTPPALPLSAGATAVWTRFHDAVEQSLGDGGALAGLRGFGAKLAENALRIAGVICCFEGAAEADENHMRRALEIANFYAGEAARQMEGARVGAELIRAEKARAWLMGWERETISLTEFMNRGPNALRKKRYAKPAFDALVEHGWLIPTIDGLFEIVRRST